MKYISVGRGEYEIRGEQGERKKNVGSSKCIQKIRWREIFQKISFFSVMQIKNLLLSNLKSELLKKERLSNISYLYKVHQVLAKNNRKKKKNKLKMFLCKKIGNS